MSRKILVALVAGDQDTQRCPMSSKKSPVKVEMGILYRNVIRSEEDYYETLEELDETMQKLQMLRDQVVKSFSNYQNTD